MLNAEKYKEEILRVKRGYNWRTGIRKGKIVCCANIECDECDAHTENGCEWTQWLLSESKLEIKERETTFILSVCYSGRVVFRVLSIHKSKDGIVYAWCEGVNKDNDNHFFNTWDYDFLKECYQKGELILC